MRHRREHKKNYIWLIPVAVLVCLALTLYFVQGQWILLNGLSGDYSADTYLIGGTGDSLFTTNEARLSYSCVVESGGLCFELTDEQGNLVFQQQFTESGSGSIEIENIEPGTYYYHDYALSEDTVAHCTFRIEEKRSNFRILLSKFS